MRVVVLGYGSMGRRRKSIMESLTGLPDVDIDVTTVDPFVPDADVREPQAGPNWVGEYDAVFVCTPPVHHSYWIEAAVDAGMPCFVEKPFCLPEEVNGMKDVYADASAPLMVGHNLLWHEGFQRFKERVSELDRYVYGARFGHRLTQWGRENQDSYSRYRDQGGGALMDCLQDVDLALEVTGGLEPVYAWQMVAGSNVTVDSEYMAMVNAAQPGSDIRATLVFDYVSEQRVRQHTAIDLDRGQCVVWDEDRGPELDASYFMETFQFMRWAQGGVQPDIVPDPFRALDFVRRVRQL